MKFLSEHSIEFSLSITIVLSLIGCLVLIFRNRRDAPEKPGSSHESEAQPTPSTDGQHASSIEVKPAQPAEDQRTPSIEVTPKLAEEARPASREKEKIASHAEKKPALPAEKRDLFALIFLFLIFLVALVLLVNDLSVPFSPSAPAETPTPSEAPATPAAVLEPEASPISNQILRFDELDPVIPLTGNFFVNGWGDDTKFHIDDRTYSYGVGLVFSGTKSEGNVSVENSPDNILRGDCKEFTVEYALRKNYTQLSFSIGADNGDPSYYGDENSRGIAEVVMSEKSTGSILFDTGWVNYTYAIYEATVDLTNVDILEITYRICGVSNLNKLKTGLRFAIVDPILVLKDDTE